MSQDINKVKFILETANIVAEEMNNVEAARAHIKDNLEACKQCNGGEYWECGNCEGLGFQLKEGK